MNLMLNTLHSFVLKFGWTTRTWNTLRKIASCLTDFGMISDDEFRHFIYDINGLSDLMIFLDEHEEEWQEN